jgi:hypothetical protein
VPDYKEEKKNNAIMRYWLFLTIALLCAVSTNAQNSLANQYIAPWLGHWKGELVWQRSADSVQTVEMHLIIAPLDSAGHYSWNLVYGAEQKDNRGYTLKPVDIERGQWIVDENNGIVIDQYLIGNCFTSAFEVMGNTIVDVFELKDDTMQVRFFSYSSQPSRVSGLGTEDIPTVNSYRMQSVQNVTLRKL